MSKELLLKEHSKIAVELVEEEYKFERHGLGKIYFIMSINLQCLSFLCAKVLFEHHANLGPCPLLVYRSSISCLILIVYLNKNLKYTLYDCIDRKSVNPLSVRVITGNFAIFVNFMAVKYF